MTLLFSLRPSLLFRYSIALATLVMTRIRAIAEELGVKARVYKLSIEERIYQMISDGVRCTGPHL